MKRLFLLAAMLFAPALCWAQQTTVTATVTDPFGQPYTFSTGYAALVCPGNQAPTFNGFSMPRTYTIVGFDGTGTFSQVVYDTSVIQPVGCGYQWHITWKDGVTTFITGTITPVSGASVNLSAAISAFAVPLPSSGGAGCSLIGGVTGDLIRQNGAQCIPATGLTTPDGNSLQIKGPDPWRDIVSYMPVVGCSNDATSLSPMSGTIVGGTAILAVTFDSIPANGCGVFVANAGAVSTVGTPTQGAAPSPTVTGPAGSTTVHYKFAAIDSHYGTSAASSAITVTTAPSTRTPTNYVVAYFASEANAIGYLAYSDLTGGGTYVPAGYSFNCSQFSAGGVCAFIDKGPETQTWTGDAFWPLTPPAAATNQALITTVVSGVPTNSLVLSATATNSATSAFTFADNSPFIGSAIRDSANDSGALGLDKGTVFIPKGTWYTDTIPYPASASGVKVRLGGSLILFGLPVEGPLSTGSSGNIAIEGDACGNYSVTSYAMSGCILGGLSNLPDFFVTATGSLELSHLNLVPPQGGIVNNALGEVSLDAVNFAPANSGTGIMLQVDANSFFHLLNHINWNLGADGNDHIEAIWLIGTTNNGHVSFMNFHNNTFTNHTIRADFPYPVGGGDSTLGILGFSGVTSVENSFEPGFINSAGNATVQSVTFDNVVTGDAQVTQTALIYSYNNSGTIGNNIAIKGQTFNYNAIVGGSIPATAQTGCRTITWETPSNGGSAFSSVGYWGTINGHYSNCDTGVTLYGYDVQTSEVLTSGGNDSLAPAGEEMIGHVFRRPYTTLTSGGGGSLAAATYYVQVSVLDVAGRKSAASPEASFVAGASSAINVSAATSIFFPASCNVYFGTSPGGEANFFNSTAVTNGTCTFTLTTVSGASTGTPPPVGNAMNSWLTEENNANSCLFCGSANGGTGAQGFYLNTAQFGNLQHNAIAAPLVSTEPIAFSGLPSCASASEGTIAAVIDSNTATWGATIAGSSTNHVLAYCDGTNWTVAGK